MTYNGSDLANRSTLTAATLIFHELAPGHQLHLARQSENEALADIRREARDIGAFNEGWAEYAAGLGWEIRRYDDPYDAYGRRVHERDLPGQALAYRLGFVEFNRIRQRAESALGSRFDVRDFHEVLLAPGALPFPVIEEHARAWAVDQLGNSS